MKSGSSTWYSKPPTWTRASSSRMRLRVPGMRVIMVSLSCTARLQGVVMAQRHRQGVGHVVRLRQLRQVQLKLDGVLHLLLGRPAVAGDGLLDAGGGVADHGDVVLRR